MTAPPTIRHTFHGRTELTERQWAAMRAMAVGYRWIDRRDGAQLVIYGLAYHNAVDGFLLTDAALRLLDPWYEDMAR